MTRGLRQAGMPLDCSRIMPWQNRKTSPSSAAASERRAGCRTKARRSASGKNTAATQASRDIQERLRLAQHVKEAQRPADLEHQQRQAERDDGERGEARQQHRRAGEAGERGEAEQVRRRRRRRGNCADAFQSQCF